MKYKIEKIEGIGPANASKLAKANILTTGDLLEACCTPKGRTEVAKQTGVGEKVLLKWANLADLMRISGIGPQFSELLEVAGVDTVKELRTRKVEHLTATMAEARMKKKVARVSPPAATVNGWIREAKSLKPKIRY